MQLPTKIVTKLFTGLLSLSVLSSSTFFQAPAFAASKRTAPMKDQFELRSGLTRVGPLHMSDGQVLIRGRELVIISDQADAIAEAELAGLLISSEQKEDSSGKSMQGQVFFSHGASLPALDDGSQIDRVKLRDGSTIEGRIINANPAVLSIKSKRGSRMIGLENVISISSPRAFDFNLSKDPDPEAKGANLASFATTSAGPSSTNLELEGSHLQVRLIKHSLATKTAILAASMCAIGACFVIPAFVAAAVQPRQNNGLTAEDFLPTDDSSSTTSSSSTRVRRTVSRRRR